MSAADTVLLLLLFAAAAGLGWFFARRSAERRLTGGPRHVSAEYFQGLNYLLNEEPDKALEVFIRMVDMDADTVDTHFALGALFRRRGETERAIKVHQNLVARPDLPREARARALNELAEDYFKAGLFDRAEQVYTQVARGASQREQGLRGLVRIYELQRDWEKAIAAMDQLVSMARGASGTVVAHYCCELAQEALARGDLNASRHWLKRAQGANRGTVRGAMMRATVAQREGDHRLAVRLYEQALERDGGFLVDVLPELRRSYAELGMTDAFERWLGEALARHPEWRPGVAFAAITDGSFDDPITRQCMVDFISGNPILTEILETLRPTLQSEGGQDAAVRRISGAMRKIAAASPRYRCNVCGFSGNVLYWQCPSCRSWDTTRPVTTFRFEAMLDPRSTSPETARKR
ncbi:MAG TPA: lipopolysaccharide assembly protein LapB [Gammaproteobacteria bacterium]|nr:lipopolysaccharide assembly protein LapB [Gammaproteobacteria bacterium]